MAISAQKLHIRRKIKSKRSNFIDHKAATIAIITRFEELIIPLLRPDEIIAAYSPNSSEIDILPLLTKLSRQYFNILLPVINNQKEIDFYPWHPGEYLVTSNYISNILEPKKQHQPIIPSVIIAPLLACDLRGNRIGSGMAMYDKYLESLQKHNQKPLYIGLCYDFQLLDHINAETHDQPLDIILTDKRFINNYQLHSKTL